MVEYDGTYQPAVLISRDAVPLDWVKPETSPEALGYR